MLENIQHETQRGMTFVNDGVGKNWTYDPISGRRTADRASNGETLFLNAAARPTESLYGDADFSIVGNYADSFWRPINDLHRQELSGERVRFRRGEATWKTDSAHVSLLQGKAYKDWKDKGDLFDLVPRQYEVERYLNFAGHAVPRVVEGEWRSSSVGEFGFIGGPEPVWGAKSGGMGRWNYRLPSANLSYIYSDQNIPYGDPNERSRSMSLALSGEELGVGYETGLLYQPFRLDRPYQRVESAAPGQGTFGSNYDVINDVTREHDAWGATLRLTRPLPPVLDLGGIGYTVRRPVAGNLEETYLEGDKKMTPFLSTHFNYTYRRPIIGPLPFLYAGTPANPGALLLNPRGPESPFWVSWRPEGALPDNREAHLLTLTAVHDPTPQTWIFKNDPYVAELDNISDKEDAPFAVVAQYTMEFYPTTTDRSFYHDKDGNLVWEPAYHSGDWATKRPVHRGTLIVLTKNGEWSSRTFLQGGQSLALANAAYTSQTNAFKPITSFFTASEDFSFRNTHVMVSVGFNVWGPEELNQRFGQTFDRLIRLGVEQRLPWSDRVGISFTRAREEDNKYIAADLGGFDEWRFYFVQKFSVLGRFREPPGEAGPRDILPETPAKTTAPTETSEPKSAGEVPLKIMVAPNTSTFMADKGQDLHLRLSTTRPRRVVSWNLDIREKASNSVVMSFSGFIVPGEVTWDGKDGNGKPAAAGDYLIDFRVKEGETSVSSSAEVRLTRSSDVQIQDKERKR